MCIDSDLTIGVTMNSFAQMQRNIRHWSASLKAVKSELAFRRALRVASKAGYREDQERDERGRWTDEGDVENVNPAVSIDAGEPTSTADDIIQLIGSVVSIDFSNALTGIQSIDETTKSLSETLAKVMQTVDFIPTPSAYGTAVHVAFGTAVRFQGLPGIGFDDVEHSFSEGTSAIYGERGSIRTDVVRRNEVGDIMAIYDVKTGSAGLTPARVDEIRTKTGTTASVPIIELHVLRGASLKARLHRRPIGRVIARLLNPAHHRDNEDRASDRWTAEPAE